MTRKRNNLSKEILPIRKIWSVELSQVSWHEFALFRTISFFFFFTNFFDLVYLFVFIFFYYFFLIIILSSEICTVVYYKKDKIKKPITISRAYCCISNLRRTCLSKFPFLTMSAAKPSQSIWHLISFVFLPNNGTFF